MKVKGERLLPSPTGQGENWDGHDEFEELSTYLGWQPIWHCVEKKVKVGKGIESKLHLMFMIFYLVRYGSDND